MLLPLESQKRLYGTENLNVEFCEFVLLSMCADYTEQILIADFYAVWLSSDLDCFAMMHSRDSPCKDVQIVTCTPDKFFEIKNEN